MSAIGREVVGLGFPLGVGVPTMIISGPWDRRLATNSPLDVACAEKDFHTTSSTPRQVNQMGLCLSLDRVG